MFSKRFLSRAIAGTAMLLGLAGCGGSGSDSGIAATTPGTGASNDTMQSPATDAFLAKVLAIIAGTSDTAEPQAIESTTVSTPEDTQPQPIS